MRQQKVSVWDAWDEVCLESVVYVKYNYVVFMITKYCIFYEIVDLKHEFCCGSRDCI